MTANADGTVKMFDGHSGNLIRTLGTHDDLAFTVEFDARGERVLSVGEDRTVRVWDAASGEQLNVLPHDTLISDASWVGMDYIASLESDGVGLVWDLSSGAVVNELRGHTGYSSALAVSSDGDRIATGSDDGTVRIWRPGEGVGHVTIHRNGFVWADEYSSDESGILTAGLTGLVERWDARTGARRRVIFDGEGKTTVLDVSVADGIAAVAFRREERGLVVSGGVVFVDPDRGIERSRYTIDGRAYPITVAMDATGRRAVGLWSDGVARVVDAEGDLVSEYEVEPPPIRLDDSLAELSPDGSRAAVVDGREIAVVETGSGELVETLSTERIDVWTLAMSADGSRVAAGLGDSTVRIWDVGSGEQISSLVGHTAYVTSVAFSPDGAYVASAALDGTARIWTVGG